MYWLQQPDPPRSLLHAAGRELLSSTHSKDLVTVKAIFDHLHATDPHDRIARAGWVAAHTPEDFAKVAMETEELSPIEHLVGNVDAQALLDAGVPSLPAVVSTAGTKRKRDGEDEAKEKEKEGQEGVKRPRTRKSKLPKDFEAGRKMDPERWLPLRDRSTYRPKGKKKGKRAAGDDLTQGGIVKEQVNSGAVVAASGGGSALDASAAGGAGGKGRKKGKGKR